MTENNENFAHIIENLINYDQPFPARMLRSFSDLTSNHLRMLKTVWPDIKRERKISLLEDLETVAESDTLVSFDELAKMALEDADSAVRVLAIRLLWECEETRLLSIFTDMMFSDLAEDVRAAAASALGKFVLLGELETIPEAMRISNVQNLIGVTSGEDLPMVRRRALESLGFSSHPKVPELIEAALATAESQWLTSALYAIGRSADERWADIVLRYIDSEDGEILFDAIRAAGELELEEARDPLLEKLDETLDDQELRFAIIWSLSQIGGEAVKKKLEELAVKGADDEEAEWIEKALDNIELGGQLESMEMLDYDANEDLDDEDIDDNDVSDEDGDEEFTDIDELDEDDDEN
jgi:HEAT repeat protein